MAHRMERLVVVVIVGLGLVRAPGESTSAPTATPALVDRGRYVVKIAGCNDDLRAIYQFVRSLGPKGRPAPAYVPPDQSPPAPYVQFPAPPK